MTDYLIAIPVYNEQKHINTVLEAVEAFGRDVLVVDDGSTDKTPDLLGRRHGIHVIRHPENLGYGQSLADAFNYANQHGYSWVVTMDCDGQHEPTQLPLFFHLAASDEADVISGTRYAAGHDDDAHVPPDRRRINREITETINQRLGLDITDAFCGFKAYRVAILDKIRITVPGYAMPMQMWVQIARANIRVREVPVRLIYNDPNRHFGGTLDDPSTRLQHYLTVFEGELAVGTMKDCAGACGV